MFGLDLSQPLIWTVPEVLSAAECAALIERMESAGTAPAPISTAQGFVMRPDIRNNTRVVLDDLPLAAELLQRIRSHVPQVLGGAQVVGVNERFRCYRYAPGQRFALHYDGAFQRNHDEASKLTFMVYLNEGFTGGATDFPENGECITPKTGMALFFQHRLLHEGCEVLSGLKYALRSDVMYCRPQGA